MFVLEPKIPPISVYQELSKRGSFEFALDESLKLFRGPHQVLCNIVPISGWPFPAMKPKSLMPIYAATQAA